MLKYQKQSKSEKTQERGRITYLQNPTVSLTSNTKETKRKQILPSLC